MKTLRESLKKAVEKVISSSTVDKDVIKQLKKDIQKALLMSDVEVRLVMDVTTRVHDRALEEKLPPGFSRKDQVVKILYDELSGLLGEETKLAIREDKTHVILLLGIQGSGKTTTCAKLAKLLADQGRRVGVIGADNYRPGALVQLRTMCERSKTKVYGSESPRKSEEIVRDGLEYFRDTADVILIDTAGRHKEERALLDEMHRIDSVARPDSALLVIDGTIGQQCYRQAAEFHKRVKVGGIIVTKLDSTSKGGGALAAAAATGASILFVSNGERVDDLAEFSPTRFVGKMLGMGDIKAILDMAKRMENSESAANIYRGKMSLVDYLSQMENVRSAGMQNLMDNIPMLAGKMTEGKMEQLERNSARWRHIVQSMTPLERDNPDIINRSRTVRIARGAGCREHDVKMLIKNYNNTKSIIKANKGRKMMGMMRRLGLG